jgi:hypothetical protein
MKGMKEVATMELRYRGKNEQPPPAVFGSYLGQGDGEIAGSLFTGAVTWDLYENQSATGCEMNMLGTIRTDAEREIGFDILGFFIRDEGAPVWRLASAIRFREPAEGGDPAVNLTGLVQGTFDTKSYTHNYRIFMPAA